MGYFQVRFDSRVKNYNRRGFIRLAAGQTGDEPYSHPLAFSECSLIWIWPVNVSLEVESNHEELWRVGLKASVIEVEGYSFESSSRQ